MFFSYDYENLVSELKESISFGELSLNSEIQILRKEEPVHQNYRPIIDWYYSHEEMVTLTSYELFDDHKAELEKKKIWDIYKKDMKKLETVSVMQCLSEMEELSLIFNSYDIYGNNQ